MVEVGPVVHSRWLAVACRILRRYVPERKPSTTLVTLTKFCVKVYFLSWCQIKSKHEHTEGLKSLFDLYKRIQHFCNLQVKNIAPKVIERNAHSDQPENILFCMLANLDESIHNAAVDKMLHI